MIRPSSLPALAFCPRFESGSSEYAEDGTKRHIAMAKLFADDKTWADDLKDEDQQDAVQWAVDYIKLKAPLGDYPINFEFEGKFITDDFEELLGHIDAECGPVLFDLKWRFRDYSAQMAAYSLIKYAKRQWKEIEVHILFGESRRVERYKITEDAARQIVEPIIAKAKDPNAEAKLCDYCGWCANKLKCPTFNAPAQAAINGREDWKLQTWHPSQIDDPAQMVRALVAVPYLRKLADSIQYHALEMWTKKGIQIEGCQLKERKGKRRVSDLTAAFNASGLDVNEFLACCDVRWTTNPKTPERPGLENTYAKHHGIPLASAKREIRKKLEPIIVTGAPSQSVVPIKAIEDLTETEE